MYSIAGSMKFFYPRLILAAVISFVNLLFTVWGIFNPRNNYFWPMAVGVQLCIVDGGLVQAVISPPAPSCPKCDDEV